MITTYLIHFNKPIGNPDNPRAQAQHYLGSTTNLKGRLYHHRHNNGSRIMAKVCQAGIKWKVVKTWESDSRNMEIQLKRRKNNRKLCPICNRGKNGNN